MKEIKSKIYDSIFEKLFSSKENIAKMYNELHGTNYEDLNIEILDIEKVLINDVYNDLGFIANDKIIMLVEAQSTFSHNIVLRMLIYLFESYKNYIFNNKERRNKLYSTSKLIIPTPELYVLYNGEKHYHDNIISLKDVYGDGFPIDAKVNIIDKNNCPKQGYVKEYIDLIEIFKENKNKYDDPKEAVNKTLDYCIENNILKDFISSRKKEVADSMMHFINEEDRLDMAKEIAKIEERKKYLSNFIETLSEFCSNPNEIYKRIIKNDDYKDLTFEEFYECYKSKEK